MLDPQELEKLGKSNHNTIYIYIYHFNDYYLRIMAKNKNNVEPSKTIVQQSKNTVEKLITELAKESVKESDAVGVNSLNELKNIQTNSKNSNNKLDGISSKISSLILSTRNQTRLSAIQMLSSGFVLFPDHRDFGYAQHSILCEKLIAILLDFNHDYDYVSDTNEEKANEYIIDCIHSLTGLKPRVFYDDDGDACFIRE